LSETLKETGGRGATGGARAGRIRSALVVAQLSLSLVLLVGAMLMIRSFLATQTANLGFRPDHVVTMDLALSGPKYRSDSTYRTFLQSIERDVAAIPGVQQVGLTGSMPIKTCCNTTDYFPEGKSYPLGEGPSAIVTTVSGGFFRTLGIPLRAGRNFDSRDTFEAPRVAIVSELFAQREWPNRSAIGQRFRDTPNDTSWVTVVGVVPFIVSRDVTQFRTSAQVYYPLEQARWRSVTIAVRTAGDPLASVAPIRERLRALDRDLPLARVEALEFTIRDRMFQPRVYGTMFAGFAATALLLASIGLYGVMAYVVSQRTHEMGIRMALGATRSSIVTLVLSGGVRLIAIGVLIGVPAALGLAQLLRRTLFGVSPTDPLTFLAIPFFLVTVALLATVIPARRAASVDPSTALHTD
jgi:putative ABC transport system permease protein